MMRRYEKDAFMAIPDLGKVDDYLKKWRTAREQSKQCLETLNKLEDAPKDKEQLAAITTSMGRYEEGFFKIVEMIKSGAISSAQDANKAIGEYKEPIHQAEKNITEYWTTNGESLLKAKKELNAEDHHVIVITISILVISFIIVLLMVTWLVRSIRKPLAQIDSMVNDIARGDGDLTARLPYAGKDELGEICSGFNLFIEKLHGVVSKVAQSALQVAAASNQLHSTADQIATGAEEVASQTGTVATASEEMSATSNDIAHNCLSAAGNSTRASETARDGAEVVRQTIDGMQRIAASVREASKTVEDLGTRSEQIGQIIGTIEDIADQTNLLALNAAIEAARAGDQGRGFAVVADEVRALAERTTRATHEIGEMIKAIQRETKGAVTAMEEGVKEVGKGTESSVKSGRALEEILEQINDVTMQVNQIATAAEEQTATTHEITTNIQQITDVVLTTARGANETAAASSQLSREAEHLQQLVRQFKL
jgi:methyl-accepting chemotaxis protein